eukprot:scaffold6358_cov267-Pinguiococcus_pyrenoidosus.AAC.4
MRPRRCVSALRQLIIQANPFGQRYHVRNRPTAKPAQGSDGRCASGRHGSVETAGRFAAKDGVQRSDWFFATLGSGSSYFCCQAVQDKHQGEQVAFPNVELMRQLARVLCPDGGSLLIKLKDMPELRLIGLGGVHRAQQDVIAHLQQNLRVPWPRLIGAGGLVSVRRAQ